MTVGELRFLLHETLRGSEQSEAYDRLLVDDPNMSKHSIILSDDAKVKIVKWLVSMGLA